MKIFLLTLVAVIVMFAMTMAQTINPASDEQHVYKPTVGTLNFLGKTKPLRDITPIYPKNEKIKDHECKDIPESENMRNPILNKDALPKGADPVLQAQRHMKSLLNIDTLLTAPGFDYTGIYPPDPNGYIGQDHYIQMVNGASDATFKVLDKMGNLVYGPALLNTIWTQISQVGWCDGVVVFDQVAQRWILLELNSNNTAMLMAVSVTSDPLGSYYAYNFTTPGLPDYPKLFIWNDGYYICTNENWLAQSPVYALDRDSLLLGQTCHLYRFPVPTYSALGFQTATGASWDGQTPPPVGSPAYILRMYDDAWNGGNDHLEVWSLAIDWADSANSTFTGPTNIQTAPFTANVGGGNFYLGSVGQPGGGYVECMDNIIMYRIQYRNFGAYESMVLNHVVDADGGGHSGIRWYELRKSGLGPWSIYQQGTFFPEAATNFFMASIAQNGAGDIALGYCVTDTISTYVSLRVVARNNGDPLGTMTYNEMQFATGLSNYSGGRWGDYSQMSVDPVDDNTFWFTGEYAGASNWSTKIVKFRLKDSNDVAVTQMLAPVTSGNLTNADTIKVVVTNVGSNPQSNFPISYSINNGPVINEMIALTIPPDSSIIHIFQTTGDFSIVNGVYNVKIYTALSIDGNRYNDTLVAQVTHLANNDAAAINVLGGTACGTSFTYGFVLKDNGADTLHSANINYSLNGNTVITYPWTGSIPQFGLDTVMITISGLLNGNNSLQYYTSMPNGVNDQNTINDTTYATLLSVAGGQVTAPLIEGFELSTFPPQYWTNTSNEWSRTTTCSGFGLSTACTMYPFYYITTNGNLVSAYIDMSSITSVANLDFNVAYARFSASYSDTILVKASLDCGNTWTTLYIKGGVELSTAPDQTSVFTPTANQWRHESIDISTYAGMPSVLFEFVAKSGYGNDAYIDDINIYHSTTTGISTSTNDHGISIYPNPSSGNFNVQVTGLGSDNIMISVYNAIGQKIKEVNSKLNGGTSLFEINMDGQSNGIYNVKIESNKTIVNKTLNLIR
jgi:hypothetical protein